MLLDLYYAAEARLFPGRARRWRAWKQHAAGSAHRVDHGPWDRFLARYLRRQESSTGIAYREATREDREALAAYVRSLEATAVGTLDHPEQFAFWCNLYNAVTVNLILSHYPVRSLRDVGVVPFWLGGGAWVPKRVSVEGWRLGLNDIEHRILRRNWRDRRIHFALNCGAVGCPELQPRAFAARTVFEDLDRAEHAYVNDPRGVRFEGDRLIVSSLFVWFEPDFVAPGETLVDYLRRHAQPELAARLAGRQGIDAHRYDWALNEAK